MPAINLTPVTANAHQSAVEDIYDAFAAEPFNSHPSHQQLIHSQLPGWYTSASSDMRKTLHDAYAFSLLSQRQLDPIRYRLSTPQDFAAPLLSAALQKRFVLSPDLRETILVTMHTQTLFWIDRRQPLKQSLLQAALLNFEISETSDDGFERGAALLPAAGFELKMVPGTGINGSVPRFAYTYRDRLAIRPAQFAKLCRELDLGRLYQAHLNDIFKPGLSSGKLDQTAQSAVAEKFMNCERDVFEVLMHTARMKGLISVPAYAMLKEWIKADGVPRWNGQPVRHAALHMLAGFSFAGCELFGALLIEADGDADEQPCVVYLPGEPAHPLKEYSSFKALTDDLRRKLNNAQYQHYWRRFIAVRDSHRFFERLNQRLTVLRPLEGKLLGGGVRTRVFDESADLVLQKIISPKPPFTLLYDQMVFKTYDDARVVAVPTDDEDQKTRLDRLQKLEAWGLDVLNLASFAVPMLGAVMAVVATGQLLREVFTGVEEWSNGETDEALAHLLDLAENLALLGVAVAVHGSTPAPVIPSRMIERALSVQRQDGTSRLWIPGLKPFEYVDDLPALAIDADGVVRHGGKTFASIEGKFYRVEKDPQSSKWQIKHPTSANAHSPVLHNNGHGAWRVHGEAPAGWSDAELFRRLHPTLHGFSEQSIERVMRITGIDAASLRQIQVEHLKPPALLMDSVQRLGLDQGIRVSSAEVDSECVRLIRRDFASLSEAAASEIATTADSTERARMKHAARLPLRIAELARDYQQQGRVNRALEGFFLTAPEHIGNDTEKAALGLLAQLPGWPADNLLAIGEVGQSRFSALLAALPQASRDALQLSADAGELELREALGERALRKRGEVAKAIGLKPIKPYFQWPQRLEDGRVGYPLSGRLRSLVRRLGLGSLRFSPELAVNTLFPGLSGIEVQAFINDIRLSYAGPNSGLKAHVRERLMAYQSEYEELNRTLLNWVDTDQGSQTLEHGVQAVRRDARHEVATRLRDCWKRYSARRHSEVGRFIGYDLNLSRIDIPEYPRMTARFDHVASLSVNDVGLSNAEANRLLKQFGNLRWLHLRGNALTSIPESVVGLRHLSRLSLRGNPLVLDVASRGRLYAMRRLRSLNLDACLIGAPLNVSPLRRLTRLSLRGSGLTGFPLGMQQCPLLALVDLRDNQIRELSAQDMQLLSGLNRRIQLHDNPLSEHTQARARETLNATTRVRSGLSGHHGHARGETPTVSFWQQGLASDQLAARLQRWNDVQAERLSADFFQVLRDLTQSQDYTDARLLLTRRVWAMLDAVAESSELRYELFAMAAHPLTCGDGVTLVFGEMEVRVMVHQVLADTDSPHIEAELFTLARGLERLDQVERIAQETITQRLPNYPGLDQAEVRLAYRVGLATRLQLPVEARGMLFSRLAGVTENMLEEAESRVLARETAPAFLQSLTEREFWMQFLERRYARRFEALKLPFHDRLEALDDALGDGMTDQAYLTGVETIQAARQRALTELAIELTRTIARGVSGPTQSSV